MRTFFALLRLPSTVWACWFLLAFGAASAVSLAAQVDDGLPVQGRVQGQAQVQVEDEVDGEIGEAAGDSVAEVFVLKLASAVQPVAREVLRDAIEAAEDAQAAALVIELDTPGGLSSTMREMVQDIEQARVPTIVYVGPSGAQAASAGFFLLMAADIAAMAPSTNTGAAASVQGDGSDIPGTMAKKVEEDGAAFIRSLAQRRGRNADLAETTVREAKAFSAEEALDQNLIDLIAPSVGDLLKEVDGREVEVLGATTQLRTAEAVIRPVEWTPLQRGLGLLADPQIAAILMSLGMAGLMVELYNPGLIFPGVVGGLCLILGLFGLSVLPVSGAGLALIGLGVLLFIAEIKVQSAGMLTIGGVISLGVGLLLLFERNGMDPSFRVSLNFIALLAILLAGTAGFLAWSGARTLGAKVRTGRKGMVGEIGRATTDLDPEGKVFVHGELWNAVSLGDATKGTEVEVTAVDGMTITVRPVQEETA